MGAIGTKRWLAVGAALLFLAANYGLFRLVGEAEAYPQRRSLAEFPLQVGSWRCPERTFLDAQAFAISGVDDYLLCDFEATGADASRDAWVNVYIGYHARQMRSGGAAVGPEEAAIHPPKHCIPGSGWDIVEADLVEIDFAGLPRSPAEVNRFVIAKGANRHLVYYWYQSRGRLIASDHAKVAYLALDRVLQGRTDGALVRFTAPIRESEQYTEASLHAVMGEIVPRLPDYLPD